MTAQVIRLHQPIEEKPARQLQGERRQRIKIACQQAAGRTEDPFWKMMWMVKARQACYLPTAELRPTAIKTPSSFRVIVDFTP